MKSLFSLLFVSFICFNVTSQNAHQKYSKILLSEEENIAELINLGLEIDHFHREDDGRLECIVSERDIDILIENSRIFEIVIPDMTKHYLEIISNEANTSRNLNCGVANFDDGELGAYHSYDDMIVHIQKMASQFPDLVKIQEIGASYENRIIYAVKISDNVNNDESATEGVVYYDALTHAREPMGLETVLYYMWWLLENYNTLPDAKYLINNREMYFVPVVNPDGYVYNQTTNPQGGGFWRKNRSVNGNCRGVDLNRNYGFAWGDPNGSSSDPCSDLYRGSSAFSEPETQVIRDFTNMIKPATAFSCHTYSDVFLCPNGFENSVDRYDLYAEFASEFSPEFYAGYGNWVDMIGYLGAGTTHDYLNAEGTVAYTPEIGHQFWEPPSEICARVSEMLPAMKFIAFFAGDYAVVNSVELLNTGRIIKDDPLEFNIRIKNKGMSKTAKNVSVTIELLEHNFTSVKNTINYGDIPPREFAQNSSETFEIVLDQELLVNEVMPLLVTVNLDDQLTTSEVVYLYYGYNDILFSDNAENGMTNWRVENGTWGTTNLDAVSGQFAFADSPTEAYENDQDSYMILLESLDLSTAKNPWLEFHAKWSFDALRDFVQPLISLNGGVTWLPLSGLYTSSINGNQAYGNTKHWVQERISLNNFIGENNVTFAFRLSSAFGRQSDGFYFDDFQIVDYSDEEIVSSIPTLKVLNSNNVQTYPNPVEDILYVDIDAEAKAPFLMQLYDLNGMLVREQKVLKHNASESISFSLNNILSGNYFLHLTNAKNKAVKKIFVQKK